MSCFTLNRNSFYPNISWSKLMGMSFCIRTLKSQQITTNPSNGVDDNDDTELIGKYGMGLWKNI